MIELLIVVVIIGILAAIAYPSYQDQVTTARRAEGKAKLLEMAQALEKCKALFGTYTNASCSATGNMTGTNGVDSENGFYLIDAAYDSDIADGRFTIRAVPQDPYTDTECGTLTIDQAGTKGEGGTGSVPDCW